MATSPSFERRFEPAQSRNKIESAPKGKLHQKSTREVYGTKEDYCIDDLAKSEQRGHQEEVAICDWLRKEVPGITDARLASDIEDKEGCDIIITPKGAYSEQIKIQVSEKLKPVKSPDIVFVKIDKGDVDNGGALSRSLKNKIVRAVMGKMPRYLLQELMNYYGI